MPRNQELRKERDAKIVRDYQKWQNEGLRHAVILEKKLQPEYHLTPRTLEAIIRGDYDKAKGAIEK